MRQIVLECDELDWNVIQGEIARAQAFRDKDGPILPEGTSNLTGAIIACAVNEEGAVTAAQSVTRMTDSQFSDTIRRSHESLSKGKAKVLQEFATPTETRDGRRGGESCHDPK